MTVRHLQSLLTATDGTVQDDPFIALRDAIGIDEERWFQASGRRARFSQHIDLGQTLEAWETYVHYTADLRRLVESNKQTWVAMAVVLQPPRHR